jgi:hypothetical protein
VSPVLRSLLAQLGRPRAWLIATGVVFALALAARARPVLRARSLPTGDSQWIWRQIDRMDHGPTAFYALRDFDLPDPPPERARLLITADEEYVLTLNGRRIGAGAFQPGALLDVYEVGPLLLPEGNRLMVELRSGKGAGGLLASLVDEATGRAIVGTDERWRTFEAHQLGLLRGWLPADRGQPALCWGVPPIGRWGRPRVGSPRPLLSLDTAPRIPAASILPASFPAGLVEGRPPGSPVLYDWRRPVEGFLTLAVQPGDKIGTALLFTGEEPPDLLLSRPTAAVMIQAGRHDWMDAVPRRFRYALLVGLVRPAAAAVIPAPAAPPARPVEPRVFGMQGPPLRTPVEDEVWSKLQRLPGVARRKEL